jgi:hypothetical protein
MLGGRQRLRVRDDRILLSPVRDIIFWNGTSIVSNWPTVSRACLPFARRSGRRIKVTDRQITPARDAECGTRRSARAPLHSCCLYSGSSSGSDASELGKCPCSFRHVLRSLFSSNSRYPSSASKSGRWRIDSMTESLTAVVPRPGLPAAPNRSSSSSQLLRSNGRSRNWRPSLRRDAVTAAVCRSCFLGARRRIQGW